MANANPHQKTKFSSNELELAVRYFPPLTAAGVSALIAQMRADLKHNRCGGAQGLGHNAMETIADKLGAIPELAHSYLQQLITEEVALEYRRHHKKYCKHEKNGDKWVKGDELRCAREIIADSVNRFFCTNNGRVLPGAYFAGQSKQPLRGPWARVNLKLPKRNAFPLPRKAS